eukprot:GFUD01012589.1.p1 GENE.GFUD01012589.1~~GFUD01012589.1.p1  ORF type:complete len:348 (-),score=95.98 GFUD01012589.1:88-978(-)
MLSSCSQKVRACLGETGLKHRKIHHILPSSGGWETKSADYLNNVNPAGTVPVLIHNGHPIYESHEQIVYIDQFLMPGGPRLTPTDPGKKALMDKWVESGAMIKSEVFEAADPWDGLSKRAGNMLLPMTMPLFCANIIHNLSIWNVLETISMIPLVSSYSFIALTFFFKIFGVEAFTKVKKLGSLISPARRGINHHFTLLTKDLEASAGPYICGEDYTLADVSMVPIFERMEYARWWTDSLMTQFPLVKKYWEAIQQREGYQASKPDMEMHNKMVQVGKQIDQWKKEHKWFNDFYEN